MPADALFEVMAGCVAGFSFPHGAALRARDARHANFLQGLKPVRASRFTQGLKPLPPQEATFRPRPLLDPHLRIASVSTTEFSGIVVENRSEKSGLKVLVEAFLLAFC